MHTTTTGWERRDLTVQRSPRSDAGFTLVELLVVITITGILLTLGASALRTYWLTQALEGSAEEIVSQLRQLQQRTDSESHPLVYGVRFEVGSSAWTIIRYDPSAALNKCTTDGTRTFSDGVYVSAANFASPSNVNVTDCPNSSQQFVFFYARGTATGGSLTLRHDITSDTETISVLPLTGRVRRT
jgi:prepilin-type N-terminal cleavage/methylation domain-containing protein